MYRIGQKNAVNVHYLVAKKTADDYLWYEVTLHPTVSQELSLVYTSDITKHVVMFVVRIS